MGGWGSEGGEGEGTREGVVGGGVSGHTHICCCALFDY